MKRIQFKTVHFKECKGASLIEYVVLIIIILSGLYIMKESISRGIFGKHKQASDSFAFGRQYDSKRSVICRQDAVNDKDGNEVVDANGKVSMTPFYDEDCYQTRVRRPLPTGCAEGDFVCEDTIKKSCQSDYCQKQGGA